MTVVAALSVEATNASPTMRADCPRRFGKMNRAEKRFSTARKKSAFPFLPATVKSFRRRRGGIVGQIPSARLELSDRAGLVASVRWILAIFAFVLALPAAHAASIEIKRLDAGNAVILVAGDLELGDIDQFR